MSDRVYASSTDHLQLCQHISYLLNSPQHPISTSTRLFLLDFLLDMRPSPGNRIYRLDQRTHQVLRRILHQIGGELDLQGRYILQDMLRLTINCHRERVRSRLRGRDSGVGSGIREHFDRNRIRGRMTSRTGDAARNSSVRCYRCREFGNIPSGFC